MWRGGKKGEVMSRYGSVSLVSHPWDVSLEEAKRIQQRLSDHVLVKDDFGKIETVLGIGIVFSRGQDQVFVGCASFSFPGLETRETSFQRNKLTFPYIPGFFAFSAGPAVLSALNKIEKPDLIMFPGRGVAHPRGLGLASHLGVLLDIPTVACSRTPLWKEYPAPSMNKGACLLVKGKDRRTIGAVVRTREARNPVFVTPGHRMSAQTAAETVLQCSPRYRIPEPLRQAHVLAKGVVKAK
jgi:deoxyribonuclease V